MGRICRLDTFYTTSFVVVAMVRFEINGIELSQVEKGLLDVMCAKGPLKSWRLSKEVNKSWYYTLHVLRGLVERGLVVKSGRFYAVQDKMKEILIGG